MNTSHIDRSTDVNLSRSAIGEIWPVAEAGQQRLALLSGLGIDESLYAALITTVSF